MSNISDNIYVFEKFLSTEECDFILNKCKAELTLSPATVYDDKAKNGNSKTNRKSSVGWISDLGFLNKRLTTKLRESFRINGMEVTRLGQYQFTEYKESDYFDWHTDSTDIVYTDRFTSIVIQLNDKYTGGILEIKNIKGESVSIENKIGTLYMFSSRLVHRVTPVEEGIRYSLVNWVGLVKTEPDKQNLI
jgi:predicted 2-oxoglutarate/Fe(II)-dependent dioxygenase YbiX